MLDPFDLEEWPLPALGPCRIYGDDRALIWALVSPEDYQWALQWRWSPIRRPGRQVYLRRNAEPPTMRLAGSGIVVRGAQSTVYLHVEIMKRTGRPAPCGEHKLVDHRDLDSLNCTRHNLRWATYSINNRNRRGVTR